jgi:hypothetical protein
MQMGLGVCSGSGLSAQVPLRLRSLTVLRSRRCGHHCAWWRACPTTPSPWVPVRFPGPVRCTGQHGPHQPAQMRKCSLRRAHAHALAHANRAQHCTSTLAPARAPHTRISGATRMRLVPYLVHSLSHSPPPPLPLPLSRVHMHAHTQTPQAHARYLVLRNCRQDLPAAAAAARALCQPVAAAAAAALRTATDALGVRPHPAVLRRDDSGRCIWIR